MIIYNVTVNVEEKVHDAWLQYMRTEHIPDVMKTGCFESHTLSRIITRQVGETGITYAIQYRCKDLNTYNTYQEEFAPALQEDHTRKFEGFFYAFRTLMEVID